jgi:signal transduction protein with GAF and PtsI domain
MAGEYDYFGALYDVAKVINASLEPDQVLGEIVRCVAAAMRVKACSLRILDSGKRTLLMGAAFGLSEGYVRKGLVLVSESGLDRRALGGKTIWIEDAQTDPDFQYHERAKSEGIRSVLVVPLMLGDNAIGVLRVYASEVRRFSEEEVRFLEASANLSAIALENARLHQALQTNFDLLIAHKYRIDDN